MFSLRIARLSTLLLLLLAPLTAVRVLAQSPTGSLQGTVQDPSGAVVPGATVTATSVDGATLTTKSGDDGHYAFAKVVPGAYTVTVAAQGFTLAQPIAVNVPAGRATPKDITLAIATAQQEVTVNAEHGAGLDTSPDNNAGAIVLKGKALDALSDDPDELQDELTALAGPAAGPNGGQIYIDGFTGGQLPPKSSIREIRINQNPFSAEYDKIGYGRIEILTKPGTDKLHGFAMINGNDSAFNSLNPFVTSEPPYYSTFVQGNVGGSINKSTSWFVSVFERNMHTNSIINAQLLNPNGQPYAYNQAVSTPTSRLDVSPRFDFQITPSNTLTVRYMYNRETATNSGISTFSLQSQALDSLSQENTLQLSDSQVISNNVVNETRFEYIRDRGNDTPVSTAPTISVPGAFTGGGSNAGLSRSATDHYELINYTTAALGKHSIEFGGRLRLVRTSDYSTAGFNGVYTYASLSTYAAGTPSQYQVVAGKPSAVVNLFDAGIFYQDDWKVRPNFTFSYGLRYEGQNRISDHADFGPRFSFAWAPWSDGKSPAKTVIRGGYGWFFDRFSGGSVMQAVQQNGINQKTYIVTNPTFSSNAPPPSQLVGGTSSPTLYNLAHNLHAGVEMQAAIGLERQLGKYVTVTGTYLNSHGIHQFYTDNVNAPLPGTYNYVTGVGTRPNGINENIYQYQSGGIYNQNQLTVNFNINSRQFMLFGFYVLNYAKSDTSGSGYEPSNPFDPHADYGRATFDNRNRFMFGGNYTAPFGISISPFIITNSGSPYNVTTGTDLNGDGVFNDRPAYATSTSTDVMQTKFGPLDLQPGPFETRVPYNIGNGPDSFTANLRVSKVIGIGPKLEGPSGGGFQGGGMGGGGGGGRGGHGGGGGLGPGGLNGGGGGPHFGSSGTPRKYNLTLTAQAQNAFNNVNLAPPVGTLTSPLFGKSNSVTGGFSSSTSANRAVSLQASFSF
jgi:hypothetical protein